MKKLLTIILICIMFITSLGYVSATYLGDGVYPGFSVEFNGDVTVLKSIIHRDMHYVPLRAIFEKFGATVYYRERDCQILALSRDGDIIRHIIGENVISFNGEEKAFDRSAILENGTTYIPIDMMSAIFYPDGISYENDRLNIQKAFYENEYHKAIKEVLELANTSNFYPERFHRYINLHSKVPEYTMQEVLYRVNLGLDYPFYENMTTIEHPYELLVLVNKYNKLPDGFTQYNLVDMDKRYTAKDGKAYKLALVANVAYEKMADAAKSQGLAMQVVSAYRTEAYQKSLYNSKIKASGKVYADRYSARAGHSEHQTGLAVDIGSTKGTFEFTPEFKWMQNHGHEYGFILRYPKGKEWITGYAYEPWHYRYVGVEAATIIHQQGITYEEYYAMYVSENQFKS